MGGLSKKATLVKELTATSPGKESLLVDSGNMLFKADKALTVPSETSRIAAEGIIRANAGMGVSLAGLSPSDLKAGIDFLKQQQKTASMAWLSLNTVDPTSGKPTFTPAVTRRINGIRVAVLGLTDHTGPAPAAGGPRIVPWETVLAETVQALSREADFVLLLSSYPLAVNKQIAKTVGGIDLILQAGHSFGNFHPTVVDNALIAQTDSRGTHLGTLDISWSGHGRWHNPGSGSPQAGQTAPASTFISRFLPLTPAIANDRAAETIVQQTLRRIATGH